MKALALGKTKLQYSVILVAVAAAIVVVFCCCFIYIYTLHFIVYIFFLSQMLSCFLREMACDMFIGHFLF